MAHLQMHLTVNEPFTDSSGKSYVRGDHIRDPERIADVTRNFHHHVVQRIAHDAHTDGSFYGDKPAETLPAVAPQLNLKLAEPADEDE